MTDDQNDDPRIGRRVLPEFPVPGPPTVPPPMTPPPPGTPPPGTLQSGGASSWRWYHALIAFFGGIFVAQIVVLLLAAIWTAASGRPLTELQDDSGFIVTASAINELIFIATAVLVARTAGRVSARDFGLRAAKLATAARRAALVYGGYFVALVIYGALVHLTPDSAPDRLGASDGTGQMLVFALLVAVLAPIAEEIFFRGMVFGALRNSIGLVPAALVSGLLFGAMHIDSGTSERLLQVIPLALFGVALALLYHWTGTLYAAIAVHATNNAVAVIAYAAKQESTFGIVLAAVLWAVMMAACILGPRLTDRERTVGPGPPGGPGGLPAEYSSGQ